MRNKLQLDVVTTHHRSMEAPSGECEQRHGVVFLEDEILVIQGAV